MKDDKGVMKDNSYAVGTRRTTHTHKKRSLGLRNHITFGSCLPIGHKGHTIVYFHLFWRHFQGHIGKNMGMQMRIFFVFFFFGRSYHSNESSDLFPVANRIP